MSWIFNRYDDTTSPALRKLRELHPDATQLLGHYSGGNDEGGYDSWTVILSDGAKVPIAWDTPAGKRTIQTSEWDQASKGWKLVTKEVDTTLVEVLDEAFDDAHGFSGFAMEGHVSGTVTIDAITGRLLDNKGQREVSHYEDF